MRFLLSLLAISVLSTVSAQIGDTLYGLARKNSPMEVYLAKMDPATGIVTNVGNTLVTSLFNLTGAALNAYDNSYHFVGTNQIFSVDLTSGAVTNSATIVNPIANSMFDNFRFNNSDSTLYGLARRYIQATQTGELYLATINTQTGVITQISPTSVGQFYALEGSAIDPYQKVYYYSDGSNIIGLDMYNGSVFSSALITFPNGGTFIGNFAYSCKDTTLYGLVRNNFYSAGQTLDSAHVYFASINPATGVVTNISNSNISPNGVYSVNAGATINPTTNQYYFNNGSEFVGVSLATGAVVNLQQYTHDNGCQFFDLMRIQSSCVSATAIRPNPSSTASVSQFNQTKINLVPNPAETFIKIESQVPVAAIEMLNMSGQMLMKVDQPNEATVNVENLQPGIYLMRVLLADGQIAQQRFVKQ